MKKATIRTIFNRAIKNANVNAQLTKFEYTTSTCTCRLTNIHNFESSTRLSLEVSIRSIADTILSSAPYSLNVRTAPGLTVVCTIEGITVDEEVLNTENDNHRKLGLSATDGILQHAEVHENDWLFG